MIQADVIYVYPLPIGQLPDFFSDLFEEEYGVESPRNKKIVEKQLVPFLKHLRPDLFTIIEFPYVDKMFRDSFYNYYSSKLRLVERDTIRISFFSKEVNPEKFRDAASVAELQELYKGFLVLRPTFPKIIGRSTISSSILLNSGIETCVASIKATVNSIRLKVEGFPHASQDNQSISCAETTIWSLMEYFGNKYPEYKPVLPSDILKTLQKFSYKRQIPSDGLSLEQMAYAVRELGFGTMIYPSTKDGFDKVISCFIGSGIPIIGVLKKDGLAHAINIIGRKIVDPSSIIDNKDFESLSSDLQILDYDKFEHEFVFIDDNHPPYQTGTINNPVGYYTDEKWHGCRLVAVVVPLYRKIYLDPLRAKKNFETILRNKKIGLKTAEPHVIRTFLASSRSYKEYIALNASLQKQVKEYILTLPMPKFIWVQEISSLPSFAKGNANGILLQDATEPTEHSDETLSGDIPVFFWLYE